MMEEATVALIHDGRIDVLKSNGQAGVILFTGLAYFLGFVAIFGAATNIVLPWSRQWTGVYVIWPVLIITLLTALGIGALFWASITFCFIPWFLQWPEAARASFLRLAERPVAAALRASDGVARMTDEVVGMTGGVVAMVGGVVGMAERGIKLAVREATKTVWEILVYGTHVAKIQCISCVVFILLVTGYQISTSVVNKVQSLRTWFQTWPEGLQTCLRRAVALLHLSLQVVAFLCIVSVTAMVLWALFWFCQVFCLWVLPEVVTGWIPIGLKAKPLSLPNSVLHTCIWLFDIVSPYFDIEKIKFSMILTIFITMGFWMWLLNVARTAETYGWNRLVAMLGLELRYLFGYQR